MSFDLEKFALQMLTEVLSFDEDTGMYGAVALVDGENKERYLGMFDPAEGIFAVEEATAWEQVDTDDDGKPDLGLATDGETHGEYPTVEEAARTLLDLSRKLNLTPTISFHTDDEDEDLDEEGEDGEDEASEDGNAQ